MEAAGPLGVIAGHIQTGLSVAGANAQNDAIMASARSVVAAAGVESEQISQAAALDRQKHLNASQLAIGRARVLGTARGVGQGGSVEAIQRQIDYDAAVNNRIIDINRGNQIRRVRSEARAHLARLAGQTVAPAVVGLTGALEGIGTGLSIAGSAKELSRP